MKFDKSIEERRRGGTRVKIPVLIVCKLLFFLDLFQHFVDLRLQTFSWILLNFLINILLIEMIFTFCFIVNGVHNNSNSTFIGRHNGNAGIIF